MGRARQTKNSLHLESLLLWQGLDTVGDPRPVPVCRRAVISLNITRSYRTRGECFPEVAIAPPSGRFANVTTAYTCTSTDGYNTMSWLSGSTRTLAVNCSWSSD